MNLNNQTDVFNYFMDNLRYTNRTFDFYVDWGKVFLNVENIEIELNILNYLVGKPNIKSEFYDLIERYPNIVSVIPILIAVREKNLEVLTNFKTPNWEYRTFTFRKKSEYTHEEISHIVEFCDKVGLLQLLRDRRIKNLVDYCIGLEVGIGTNARKNRGGKIMEDIIEWHIHELCTALRLDYIVQATKGKILEQWNLVLPIDKSSRQYDFAILNNDKIVLIETNFFSGGGSKLKSVAGEFQSLDTFLKTEDIVDKFIWITDGVGWITAKSPLKEAFIHNDFIINTKMIFDGVLEEIIKI
jgi:type II restriction enzyme